MLVRSRRESRKRSNGICLTGGGSVDEVVLADEDLALAMQSGNDVAFEALVHRYHGALVGYLYRMCHDYHFGGRCGTGVFRPLLHDHRKIPVSKAP